MGHGCAFLPPEMAAKVAGVHCPDYVDASDRYLTEHVRSGDVVFIGQVLMRDPIRQTPLYFDFIKTFAKDAVEKGALVVLLDSTVPPDKPPEYCLDVPWRVDATGCTIMRTTVAGAYESLDQLALDAAREIPNFYYAPLRTGLCCGAQCGQKTSVGTPIWHDRGHVTEEASLELTPVLWAVLEKQGFFEAAVFR